MISKKSVIDELKKASVKITRAQRADIDELIKLAEDNNVDIQHLLSDKEPESVKAETVLDEPLQVEGVDSTDLEAETVIEHNTLDDMIERMNKSKVKAFSEHVDEVGEGANIIEFHDPIPFKKPKGTRQKKKDVVEPFRIEGYLIMLVLDMSFPFALCYIANMFEKNDKKKISSGQISLTEDQKNTLAPLADKVAESMTFNMNPLTAFFLVSSLSYGMNIFMLKQSQND